MQLDESVREELYKQGDFAVQVLGLDPVRVARVTVEAIKNTPKSIELMSRISVPDGYMPGSEEGSDQDSCRFQANIRSSLSGGRDMYTAFSVALRENLRDMILSERNWTQNISRNT